VTLALEAADIAFDPRRASLSTIFLRTTIAASMPGGRLPVVRFTKAAEATARMAVQNAFAAKRRRLSLMTIRGHLLRPEIAIRHARLGRERTLRPGQELQRDDAGRRSRHHDGQDDGFVKIHVKLGTDRILGATIVCISASEMINEISVAMSTGIGMRKLAKVLHTYPAQSARSGWPRWPIPSTKPVSWLQKAFARWSPDRSARQRRVDDGLRFAQEGPQMGPRRGNSRRRSCIYLRYRTARGKPSTVPPRP